MPTYEKSVPVMAVWFAVLVLANVAGEGKERLPTEAQTTPPNIVVRDGTEVDLRFTKAVWGYGTDRHSRGFHAQRGDVVPLVVAADVFVAGEIVIHKGSPAQATVRNIWKPWRDRNGVAQICVCISLEFNWVRSLDAQELPLRYAAKEGKKAGSFAVNVESTASGSVAEPYSFHLGMKDVATLGFNKSSVHRRDWIPPGTRVTAFIDQDQTLDSLKIREVQGNLPLPNENGLVMIYTTKGHKNARPLVSCDARDVAQLGSKQFVTLEMNPGEHACRVEQGEALSFSVFGGHEYYFSLHYNELSRSWGISAVNNYEGEDGVGSAEGVSFVSPPASRPPGFRSQLLSETPEDGLEAPWRHS